MPDITQTCSITNKPFIINEKEQKFYGEMDLPLPTLCPEERQRNRLAWRNEVNLYKAKCSLTGKDMISIYSQDKNLNVWQKDEWYSDKWDPCEYGREYDFNQPFFDQFKELLNEVPKLNLLVLSDNENSEYTHDNYRLKNCYLVFDGEQGYDCMYGETFVLIKNCVDFFQLTNCEHCYECVRCTDCYNLHFSSFCNNCSDSYFLEDCSGCRNCFGCCNLRQKEYHIMNKPYSKEEYEEKIKSFQLSSHKNLEKIKQSAKDFFLSHPKKFVHGHMNENVVGDFLYNCKDCTDCYDCHELRDCMYCTNCQLAANDCMDIDIWGDRMEFCYNCEATGAGAKNIIGCYYVAMDVSNIYHSYFCFHNVQNCIGCVGLRQKKNCILNKQYSKEEYERLAPRVIEHMKSTGEWGQFLPVEISPFAYNETVANDFLPLTKEEAVSRGYKWKEKDLTEYAPQSYVIPDIIKDVPETILQETLACEDCGRNYRINETELKFLNRLGFPIPHKCFFCRHQDRKGHKPVRHLFDRKCMKCEAGIKTTYDEKSPEIIYCEKCYQSLF